jgi:hypothetical protein
MAFDKETDDSSRGDGRKAEAQRHWEPVVREPILPFHSSLRIT